MKYFFKFWLKFYLRPKFKRLKSWTRRGVPKNTLFYPTLTKMIFLAGTSVCVKSLMKRKPTNFSNFVFISVWRDKYVQKKFSYTCIISNIFNIFFYLKHPAVQNYKLFPIYLQSIFLHFFSILRQNHKTISYLFLFHFNLIYYQFVRKTLEICVIFKWSTKEKK